MCGVAFLPEELERTQEQPRPHLPAHDVRPLVDEDGQVAIALHPLRVHRVNNGFGSGADDQRLLELLSTAMGDNRRLGREALHVLGFLVEKAFGDQQRKVRVLVTSVLEHRVELLLHPLPDAVPPRSDDHAPTHWRIVGKLGAQHHLVVPGAEILGAFCQFLIVSHWR